MHHIAFVIVTTAVVLAGSVWHLPALQTIRAGQDRPRSAQLQAGACLVGWGSGLALALVLLLARTAPPALLTLAVGEAGAAVLGLRAVRVRRRERRVENLGWAELGCTAEPRDLGGLRRSVLGWTLAAAAAGSLCVAFLLTAGSTTPALLLATGLSASALAAAGALTVQHRLGPQASPRGKA